jgi:hypothetical protein
VHNPAHGVAQLHIRPEGCRFGVDGDHVAGKVHADDGAGAGERQAHLVVAGVQGHGGGADEQHARPQGRNRSVAHERGPASIVLDDGRLRRWYRRHFDYNVIGDEQNVEKAWDGRPMHGNITGRDTMVALHIT